MVTPVIGITSFCEDEKNIRYNKIRCNYVNAVYQNGGLPVIIPSYDNKKILQYYLDLVDALVFSGGRDIDPSFYGEKRIFTEDSDIDRDKWEIALFKKAYKSGLPILGICRGMQLINVALGGSLYQDIDRQYDCEVEHHPLKARRKKKLIFVNHEVYIFEGTQLVNILGVSQIEVNSHHHQAINKLAEGLMVTAKSKCGLIEAVEGKLDNFLLGVQWHPEDLIDGESYFNNIFASLVEAGEDTKKR